MHHLGKLTRHTCHCWFFALFSKGRYDDCPFHFQRVNPKSEAWYISEFQVDCQKKQSPVVSDDVPLERETDDREQAHQSEVGLNRLENLTPTETKKRGMAEFAFTEKKKWQGTTFRFMMYLWNDCMHNYTCSNCKFPSSKIRCQFQILEWISRWETGGWMNSQILSVGGWGTFFGPGANRRLSWANKHRHLTSFNQTVKSKFARTPFHLKTFFICSWFETEILLTHLTHTYEKKGINRDWVLRSFFWQFLVISELGSQIYIVKSAILIFWVFLSIFLHKITL